MKLLSTWLQLYPSHRLHVSRKFARCCLGCSTVHDRHQCMLGQRLSTVSSATFFSEDQVRLLCLLLTWHERTNRYSVYLQPPAKYERTHLPSWLFNIANVVPSLACSRNLRSQTQQKELFEFILSVYHISLVLLPILERSIPAPGPPVLLTDSDFHLVRRSSIRCFDS